MDERANRERRGAWIRELKNSACIDSTIKRRKISLQNGHGFSEHDAVQSNSSSSTGLRCGSSSVCDFNYVTFADDDTAMHDPDTLSALHGERLPLNCLKLPAFPEYDRDEVIERPITIRDNSPSLCTNLDLPAFFEDVITATNPLSCLADVLHDEIPNLSLPGVPYDDISPLSTKPLTSQQNEGSALLNVNLPAFPENDDCILDEKSGKLLKAFTCDDCSKKYRKKKNLITHIAKEHKIKSKKICKKEIRKTKKTLRAAGKEYKTLKGKTINPRVYQTFFCRKCTYKCTDTITQEETEKLFQIYWKLGEESGDQDQQRQYISNHVEIVEPIRRRIKTNSRKQNSMAYYVTINEKRIRVCRYFFLNCHGVTEKFVRMALKKRVDNSGLVQPDLRGRQPSKIKTSDENERFARNHILSIPAVESHYCRKSSTRQYLPAELNLNKLYEMYTQSCRECNKVPISISVYKKYFYSYNLSFHTPRKDTCNTCQYYESLTSEQKDKEKENHDNHSKLKDRAREIKNEAVAKAKENPECSVINFDMQAVLECPKGKTCAIFYKRKFAVYNLTIYDLITHQGICNIWTECEGKRGSIEIATCVYRHIESSINKKHFFFVSDSCGGQNRNQFFATACLHAVKLLPHVETIDHVFYEPGHSQQEGDSMHSAIERAAKNITVNAPVEWVTICKVARKNPEPYIVNEYRHDDFIVWKEVATKHPIKKSPSVSWLKIKWLRYDKKQDNKILYRYDYDSAFMEMDMVGKPARSRRSQTIDAPLDLPKAYVEKIPMTKAKHNDLISLCRSGVISRNFHRYYEELPFEND